MSFFTSRLETAAGLRALQKNICEYGGLPNKCDCKFGISFPRIDGEQNGCPEVVSAIQLLEAMTDDEYLRISKRAGALMVSDLMTAGLMLQPPIKTIRFSQINDHRHKWIKAPLGWGCSVPMRNGEVCNRVAVIACDEKKHPGCLFGVCADHKHYFIKKSKYNVRR